MPTIKPAPLGVRLNNPLNVKQFHETWDGSVGQESGFVKFSKPEYGIRCAGIILLGYAKRGKDTIREIVNTFAPPSENDSDRYAENVGKWTGWDIDTPLDLIEGDNLFTLLRAMSRQEIGPGRFGDKVFMEGARMALEKKRVKPQSEKAKEKVAAASTAAATGALTDALTAVSPMHDVPGVRWLIVGLAATLAGVGLYFILRGRKPA